jgi:hypothetical protein
MKLFGFEIRRPKEDQEEQKIESFAPKENDDGAIVVAEGGVYGTYVDLDGSVKTEAELVSKYREMSLQSEIDMAIDDIINEVIVTEEDKEPISLYLDDIEDLDDNVKSIIHEEFKEIIRLFEFDTKSYQIFRRWYIDGRLYYHVIIDPTSPLRGILELRYIDPRKIRKVREVTKGKDLKSQSAAAIQKISAEYFMYSDQGFEKSKNYSGMTTGLKIAKDSIIHSTSGLTDPTGKLVYGYLQKAIKPLNQLRALEDATVIYRISRAPERRIFYIDVGNLPKLKAEQYLKEMMTRYKNKLVYDSTSGEIRDDRKFMTMLEDFWLPRREGGKGTEISTLPGGQNLGQMDDVLYFQKRLYKSLNVPFSRLESENSAFSIGRVNEITRDELKFQKFIDRLRQNFGTLFLKAMEKQLVLKGIMSPDQWISIEHKIKFRFPRDNYFAELKDMEVLSEKIARVTEMQMLIGKYYSHEWVRKHILKQTDDEIALEDELISAEKENPQFMDPMQQMIDPNTGMPMDPNMMGQPGMPPGQEGQFPPGGEPEGAGYAEDEGEIPNDEVENKPFVSKNRKS